MAVIMIRYFATMISAAILLLSMSSPIQATAASTVRVAVEVFVCSVDRNDAPVLSTYAAGSGNLRMHAAPRWVFNGDAWRTSVDVPQGHYVVSARSKRCGQQGVQWYAQPGAI